MKCPRCGLKHNRFDLRKDFDKTLWENIQNKTMNWKNLFKMELTHVLFFIAVIIIIFGYKADMSTSIDIMENPCSYALEAGCEGVTYCDGNFYNQYVDPEREAQGPGYLPDLNLN